MADLDVLYPNGIEVKAGGETITVLPIKFGKVPQASKLVAPISKQIAAAIKQDGERTVLDTALLFVDLLASSGEELLAALGFFVGKPREWFDTLDNDEGLALMNAVFQVNKDFFTRRVLPLFAPATPADQPTGANSSQSSSPADTASTPSATTP